MKYPAFTMRLSNEKREDYIKQAKEDGFNSLSAWLKSLADSRAKKTL